jgi:hypothetical protein
MYAAHFASHFLRRSRSPPRTALVVPRRRDSSAVLAVFDCRLIEAGVRVQRLALSQRHAARPRHVRSSSGSGHSLRCPESNSPPLSPHLYRPRMRSAVPVSISSSGPGLAARALTELRALHGFLSLGSVACSASPSRALTSPSSLRSHGWQHDTHTLNCRHTAALGCIAVRVLYTRAGCAGLEQSIVLALVRISRVQLFQMHAEGLLETFKSSPCAWRPTIAPCVITSTEKGSNRQRQKSHCRNHRKADVRPRTFSPNHLFST